MKKVFIISAVLLGVTLLFLGIYNFAFKEKTAPSQQAITAPAEVLEKVLPIKTEKITLMSDGAVIGPVVDKKTEEIKYYDALTGLVWKTDSEGKGKTQITNTKVMGLKKVSWSNDLSKVLTVTQNGERESFFMYDNLAQKGTNLKTGLDTVVWDNLGTKIIYKYFDAKAKERTLNIANPDGSEWKKLIDTDIRSVNIATVPLTSVVSFWNAPNASEETRLQTIGITGGETKTVLSGKYGADYLWAPDGSRALVSSLSEKNKNTMTLGTVSIGGEYQDLSVPTIVSKCVWSQDSKNVYYALAGGIPEDAVMPNDYQENKFNTTDTFWKINILTGEKKRIVETEEITALFDSTNMMLSATEDALYFINKVDQKLYRIEL